MNTTFFQWYADKERSCQPIIDWLDANAPQDLTWSLWHTGGGCTCYRNETTHKGETMEVTLSMESDAEPRFSDEHGTPWALIFYAMKGDEQVGFYTISETQTDLREVFKPENMNINAEFCEV